MRDARSSPVLEPLPVALDRSRRWRVALLSIAIGAGLWASDGVTQNSVAGQGSTTAQSPVAAESRCADCHFAMPSPGSVHLSQWDLSQHGRQDVGCESCHGGDATTFDIYAAHEGILSGVNPSSPTHQRNLPATCGKCHSGPYQAFQQSRHAELLRSGERFAPSCSTCHTDAGAFLLSSRGLQRTCKSCHGEGREVPAPDRPELAARLHRDVVDVREMSKAARKLIRRVKDPVRREQLEAHYASVQSPLREAIQSAHEFTFERFEERLAIAYERAEALLERLASSTDGR